VRVRVRVRVPVRVGGGGLELLHRPELLDELPALLLGVVHHILHHPPAEEPLEQNGRHLHLGGVLLPKLALGVAHPRGGRPLQGRGLVVPAEDGLLLGVLLRRLTGHLEHLVDLIQVLALH
jgi:hypothetical protein